MINTVDRVRVLRDRGASQNQQQDALGVYYAGRVDLKSRGKSIATGLSGVSDPSLDGRDVLTGEAGLDESAVD